MSKLHDRGWRQFGLRSLLLFAAVAGPLLGWLGVQVREAIERQRVRQQVRSAIQGNVLVLTDFSGSHTVVDWPNEGQPQTEGP